MKHPAAPAPPIVRRQWRRLAAATAGAVWLMTILAGGALAQSNEAEVRELISRTQLRPDQIMFIIRSTHLNVVDVEFYSQSRNAAWPGGNQVYSIGDYDWHTYVLNCQSGEMICYGAGVRNNYDSYWGVGINDRHGCSNCCYRCEGGISSWITLEP